MAQHYKLGEFKRVKAKMYRVMENVQKKIDKKGFWENAGYEEENKIFDNNDLDYQDEITLKKRFVQLCDELK